MEYLNKIGSTRYFVALLAMMLIANLSSAQVAPHVLGLRFGTGDGFGTEISYQHGLSAENRVEVDLGFNSTHEYYLSNRYNYNSWGLTGVYHWVKKLNNDFNWYLGPGARLGAWSYDKGYDYRYSNGLFLAAAGDIGVEYLFPVGIQLALNLRPEIGLINLGTTINVGFAVRYQFK